MATGDHEVVGTVDALAFLFSGGHAIDVRMRRSKADRAARRKELAGTWSRAVMAKIPHQLSAARQAFADAHGGRVASNRVMRKYATQQRAS